MAAFPFPFGHLSNRNNIITMANRVVEKANGRNVVRKRKTRRTTHTAGKMKICHATIRARGKKKEHMGVVEAWMG